MQEDKTPAAQQNGGITAHIHYDDKAIRRIIGNAVEGTPGVLGPSGGLLGNFRDAFVEPDDVDVTRGVTVHNEDGTISAEVLIISEENADMIRIIQEVGENVKSALEKETGLSTGNIHVEIIDTMTPEAYAEKFKQED